MVGKPKDLIVYLATREGDKEYEVKEIKRRRSLNANAYYWTLVNEIAKVLNHSKEEIHRIMLKRYGETYSMLLPASMNISGLVKYYEKESTIRDQNGNLFNSYKAYLPSSEMDSKQMATLIDGAVYEAKELNIETLPPYEVDRLKSMWGGVNG